MGRVSGAGKCGGGLVWRVSLERELMNQLVF